MAQNASGTDASLVQGIVNDAGRLIEQQFKLLRSELAQEFDKAKGATVSLSMGAGLVAVGGILGALTLVHLLHRMTRLPLWSCYGLVGGATAAGGAGLLSSGMAEMAKIRLVRPQTAETLREDANTLKQVVSRAGA